MIKIQIPKKSIFLNRRTLTEVSIILLALAITFYAGYTLGQDNNADDKQQKTNTTQTVNILKNTISTSTPFIVN